jgi:hypothetical protein
MRIAVAVALLLIAGQMAGASWSTGPCSVSTDFGSYTVGSLNGQDGWVADGSPVLSVAAANGVGGGAGVASGQNPAVWTSKPFSWTNDVAVGQQYIARMDFQASGNTVSTAFDDDRIGWTTSNTTSSTYDFGIQADNTDNGGGIGAYWKIGGTTYPTKIASLPATLVTGAFYRLEADITKLTATSARIDVSFVQLDASGNPTGTVTTGTLADTSAVTNPAPASYFNTASMYPMFKNYNSQSGAADNAYFAITPEPATLSLLAIGGLLALRRRSRQ